MILEGADAAARFDGLGRRSGRMAWWRRTMQQLAMDQMPDFLWYEEALRQGRPVVAVRAPKADLRSTAVAALQSAGAHFINYFGSWTTEAHLTLARGGTERASDHAPLTPVGDVRGESRDPRPMDAGLRRYDEAIRRRCAWDYRPFPGALQPGNHHARPWGSGPRTANGSERP